MNHTSNNRFFSIPLACLFVLVSVVLNGWSKTPGYPLHGQYSFVLHCQHDADWVAPSFIYEENDPAPNAKTNERKPTHLDVYGGLQDTGYPVTAQRNDWKTTDGYAPFAVQLPVYLGIRTLRI